LSLRVVLKAYSKVVKHAPFYVEREATLALRWLNEKLFIFYHGCKPICKPKTDS
jgi:hypothetical protein